MNDDTENTFFYYFPCIVIDKLHALKKHFMLYNILYSCFINYLLTALRTV